MVETKEIFAKPVYKEAAKLTGCKNFSRIKRVDVHTAEILDWGLHYTAYKNRCEKIFSESSKQRFGYYNFQTKRQGGYCRGMYACTKQDV
mgnify:CR=1 FL=1